MIRVKGLPTLALKKIAFLKFFGLTAEQAYDLKKGKEIEFKDANALLQAGFVEVVEVVEAPKQKPIKVWPEKKVETKPIKPIVPKKDEEV